MKTLTSIPGALVIVFLLLQSNFVHAQIKTTNLTRENVQVTKTIAAPIALNEIDDADLSDANTAISNDALRIYFLNNERKLVMAERGNTDSKFRKPYDVYFIDASTRIKSFWLSSDELDLCFINRDMFFHTARKSIFTAFSDPLPVNIESHFSNLIDFTSPSLNSDQTELYMIAEKMYDFEIDTPWPV